jgi:hypothetical protein
VLCEFAAQVSITETQTYSYDAMTLWALRHSAALVVDLLLLHSLLLFNAWLPTRPYLVPAVCICPVPGSLLVPPHCETEWFIWISRVAQVVERLPSKCEALSANPSSDKKIK